MYIKNVNESNGVHNLTKEYPGSKEDFYYWARSLGLIMMEVSDYTDASKRRTTLCYFF